MGLAGLDRLQPLTVTDHLGRERAGFLVWVRQWDEEAALELRKLGGDFRIALLQETAQPKEDPPPRTVLCIPGPRVSRGRVREAMASYDVRTSDPSHLAAAHVRSLAAGTLAFRHELRIGAAEIFTEERPDLELLARELLRAEDLAQVYNTVATALLAPRSPDAGYYPDPCLDELRALLRQADAAVSSLEEHLREEPQEALGRLSAVSKHELDDDVLAAARSAYPELPRMAEDVYLLRMLTENPKEASEVLGVRAWMESASVPSVEPVLTVDRAIVDEHLRFANIVPELERLSVVRAAVSQFQARYRSMYQAHHRAYWQEMSALRSRLLEAERQVAALEKLNTLTELGPPVGEHAMERHRELLEQTSGCTISDLAAALPPVCPACRLEPGQAPPVQRVDETLSQLERAIRRHMERLSPVAVRELLQRDDDPRLARFLRVVQASQLSSLPDILDDDLVGYLRRFLVEMRLASILEPLLQGVQKGQSPPPDTAREAMRELARVMARALSRSTPPSLPGAAGKRDRGARRQ